MKVTQSCTGFAGVLYEALYDTCFWTSIQAIQLQIIPTQTFGLQHTTSECGKLSKNEHGPISARAGRTDTLPLHI